ncbi:MAG: Na(+)/H(+) antiporter subunit B [Pseudomonadota bacterium]|nr:Na(+)/H(+) antiporter subunit B [Pseudomonadota bacterium]
MRDNPVLRVVTKIAIPLILLFALYVQFHGDYGPGGGFQAGVIFAAAFILYALVFGTRAARTVVPPAVLRTVTALGLILFAGVGTVSQLLGSQFLDYDALANNPLHGQHIGIFLVELAVGITVAAVMITLFLAFAGRQDEL